MRKAVLIGLMVSVFALSAYAQDKKGTITVVFKGLKNEKGRVSAVLYDSADAFPKDVAKAVAKARSEIKGKQATVVFENVPYGEYAAVMLHDENENAKMDYSTLGMPLEGYGFSNNAKGMLGPPDFKDAKFKLDKPKVEMTIDAIY